MADNEQNEQTVADGENIGWLFLLGVALVVAGYIFPCKVQYVRNPFSFFGDEEIETYSRTLFKLISNPKANAQVLIAPIVIATIGALLEIATKSKKVRMGVAAILALFVFISLGKMGSIRGSGFSFMFDSGWFEVAAWFIAIGSMVSLAGAVLPYLKNINIAAIQSAGTPSGVSSAEMEISEQANTSTQVDTSSQESTPAYDAPISMWGYFGYEILYCIPVIGQIVLIYNALAAKNRNVKNFACSYFCLLIVVAIVIAIAVSKMGMSSAFGRGW